MLEMAHARFRAELFSIGLVKPVFGFVEKLWLNRYAIFS
jgi:hypothetical protein